MDDEPTICDPSDIYNCLENHPEMCAMVGIFTLEDADEFVKKMYKEECWPERLKR